MGVFDVTTRATDEGSAYEAYKRDKHMKRRGLGELWNSTVVACLAVKSHISHLLDCPWSALNAEKPAAAFRIPPPMRQSLTVTLDGKKTSWKDTSYS